MIYVLEDDVNIRKLVCYSLSKEGYEVTGFAKPCELWREMANLPPNLLLLDIMLPDEDGLAILEKLKKNEKYRDIPIIMLSAKGSEYDKVTGLDKGADDYIAKPFGIPELSARVNAVLRRYEKTDKTDKNAEYKICGLYVNPSKHIVKAGGREVDLSYKEYSLLLTLLEADGAVVKRDDLLTAVWGEYYEESRTLDVHIRKLRVKLGDAGARIKTVKNIGYKLSTEAED